MNWFWRSIVVLLTIFFIYLLFPLFIVPSKLPAVAGPEADDYVSIYQVEAERVLTLKDRWRELKQRHRQGVTLIRASVLTLPATGRLPLTSPTP